MEINDFGLVDRRRITRLGLAHEGTHAGSQGRPPSQTNVKTVSATDKSEEPEPFLYITYSVPNMSDIELRALSLCTQVIEGHLKEDKDAMRRVVDYLVARYRYQQPDLVWKT